ncbi:hypothetical protein ACLF6K_06160 [Streptomyces xanthophaeus]|uniref:hypothetical protein n=1 Tax=Streptomyces xanthophaeus TaxID=67385 RepID=UPI0039902416
MSQTTTFNPSESCNERNSARTDTFRAAHSDGTGYCGHCRGTGLAGGTGGAALLAELPADDGSHP